jgi:hypothetical protein
MARRRRRLERPPVGFSSSPRGTRALDLRRCSPRPSSAMTRLIATPRNGSSADHGDAKASLLRASDG